MHEFLHPSPFTYGLFMVSFPSKKLKQEDISRIPSRLSDIHALNDHSKLSQANANNRSPSYKIQKI